MTQYSWSDCPENVRQQIVSLVDELRSIVGPSLVGVYLHGSLATGCFNPNCSDLDILALSRRPCSLSARRRLAEFLLDRSKDPIPIELSLLSLMDLSPWRYPTPFGFHYGEDHRSRMQDDLATGRWIEWDSEPTYDSDLAAHVTMTVNRGVCLWGAPIASVFPHVPDEDFRSSIFSDFEWACDHVVESPVYAILNMCRVSAYVHEGKILSKQEAGEWALRLLPDDQAAAVRTALVGYSNKGTIGGMQIAALVAFATFMRDDIESVLAQTRQHPKTILSP